MPRCARRHRSGVVQRMGVEVTEDGLDRSDDDEQRHVGDEEVGREGEDPAGLADATQVAVGDQDHEADGDPHGPVVMAEAGEDRDQGVHAGGHRHRHGERVVDEQRHRRDLGDAQVRSSPCATT